MMRCRCRCLVLTGFICMSVTRVTFAAEPEILSVWPVSRTVGVYEKFELRIDLRADFTNPFDPSEVDLCATFESPSGQRFDVWGFYNPSSWQHLWMVRFAPTGTGEWSYSLRVKTPGWRRPE